MSQKSNRFVGRNQKYHVTSERVIWARDEVKLVIFTAAVTRIKCEAMDYMFNKLQQV